MLLKIFPVYAATMLVWQFGGLAHAYQGFLAFFLNTLLPAVDASGLVHGVGSSDGEWIVRILFQGRRAGLNITAADITSNTAFLIALFLASPIRPALRSWAVWFVSTSGALLVIHLVTAVLIVQFAFSTNPELARVLQYGDAAQRFLLGYRDFYVQYGMYLFVLALWCPYLLRRLKTAGGDRGARRGRVG